MNLLVLGLLANVSTVIFVSFGKEKGISSLSLISLVHYPSNGLILHFYMSLIIKCSYNTGGWQYRQSCFRLDIQVSKQNNLDSCQKSREVF